MQKNIGKNMFFARDTLIAIETKHCLLATVVKNSGVLALEINTKEINMHTPHAYVWLTPTVIRGSVIRHFGYDQNYF